MSVDISETTTWFLVVCPECEKVGSPKERRSAAEVDLEIHNDRKHPTARSAGIYEFEAEKAAPRSPTTDAEPDFSEV